MDPTDIFDPGWLDSVLGAGGGDVAPSDGGSGMADGNWLDSILGTVSDVASSAGDALGAYYGAQQTAQNQANQRAYMSQLAATQAQQGAQTQKQVIYLGAALLMFVLLLRQTGQAR